MGFVTYLGPPFFFVKNGWLVGPQRVLPGPIGGTAEVSFAGKFECWRLAAVMSKYMIDMMILRGSVVIFVMTVDFCYAVMMSCLFIIHKKFKRYTFWNVPWPWPHHVERVRDIFGPWDVSWLRFSGKKRRKKWRRLRDRNVAAKPFSIRDALKPHPENIPPAKKQLPPLRVKTRCKYIVKALHKYLECGNRFV